jgi:aryl-alcohol dehydrogenase-like predicted oxidoreductase
MSGRRRIGPFDVPAVGLGCMSLSHAYGTPPDADAAEKVLHAALDMGCTFLDTAALYGFGANEALIGNVLKGRRGEYVLASKCGMTGVDGKRVIDGRPATLKKTCDESLARLKTDVIDLYYLHRWDKQVPIEDSVGALADLVRAGKVKTIGLSEVSAATLRKAHAVHPIAALQSEYSLWTRNPEIATLAACKELGTAFVAFSPVGRGFLAGALRDAATLESRDIRRGMPRFQGENFAANLALLDGLAALAHKTGHSLAQLSLAWVLSRGPHVVAIPGTTSLFHLAEDFAAHDLVLDPTILTRLDALINPGTVHGRRYNAATESEIDTESNEI